MNKGVLYFVLALIPLTVFASARRNIDFNAGWKFSKGDHPEAKTVQFDASAWQSVHLPHDWAISGPFDPDAEGSTGKLPWQGQGWYRKPFNFPDSLQDRVVRLLFDGVMAFPKIYLNGKLVGEWDYGYNSFYIDISDHLKSGKNVVAVSVDTRQHESRWYPGAGIYRKVTLLVTDPVAVDVWGTQITTPTVSDERASVRIKTTIHNRTDSVRTVNVSTQIIDPEGTVVVEPKALCVINAGDHHVFSQYAEIENPVRWDIENPERYTVRSEVRVNETITDFYESMFGVRTFKFRGGDRFYLNGRKVHLKGVNLHHDHGPLGAAFYPAAMERKIRIMKEMGCNAIRSSHNVPAPELAELCDKHGMLLFDEAFDKWNKKADILSETDFREFAERQIGNFIRRDRNHPSVIIWSTGNELWDLQRNENNATFKIKTMTEMVRKYDPTRPVTWVMCIPEAVVYRHFDYFDVHSWNYSQRWEPAYEAAPDKAVIVSESASTVSTRGWYNPDLPGQKTDFDWESGHVSSYDLNAPAWAEIPDDDFMWYQDDEYLTGEFVWTGFDYLGEPTPFNGTAVREGHLESDAQTAKSSYFGIVDLCGIPKDRYYLYKSHWNTNETTIHMVPHWNWQGREGQTIPVFVYTSGDSAELFLNGLSLGGRCKTPGSKISVERYRLMWKDVQYQPGELVAVAYKEGREIGRTNVRTTGEPRALRLSPESAVLQADGYDLCYILVEAVDEQGTVCPLADDLVHFKVKGPAAIAGVGNGNPQSCEPFQADYRKLFNGKAMLILKSRPGAAGTVTLHAAAKGLDADKAVLQCVK
ncbi:MAG: glycoside hydrolase family 2 TIM barrel-domain containing protein [candidate division KSB1 bacterium]|nr:glycoside hydrolase family 2 TIM barrel-domain containing protein [candidate division KSB1 bacterium]